MVGEKGVDGEFQCLIPVRLSETADKIRINDVVLIGCGSGGVGVLAQVVEVVMMMVRVVSEAVCRDGPCGV